MKVTFELPAPLVQRFRANVPNGERSKLVASLLEKQLRHKSSALQRAAEQANRLRKVTKEMKAWEALNEYED